MIHAKKLLSVQLLVCSFTVGAAAQTYTSTQSGPKLVAGPVELQSQPDIGKWVEAFPRLIPGPAVDASTTQKINDALQRADDRMRKVNANCMTRLQPTAKPGDAAPWFRTIRVTMRGPRFVSFVAVDESRCSAITGGGWMTLAYDLKTGTPVNWVPLLPPGLHASLGTAADGTRVGLITWPDAQRLSERKVVPDCVAEWKKHPAMRFTLTPDAEDGTLDVTPEDSFGDHPGCALTIELNAAAMTRMHVAPELIQTLEAAKKLQPTRQTLRPH